MKIISIPKNNDTTAQRKSSMVTIHQENTQHSESDEDDNRKIPQQPGGLNEPTKILIRTENAKFTIITSC
jgi:hypothetical protein